MGLARGHAVSRASSDEQGVYAVGVTGGRRRWRSGTGGRLRTRPAVVEGVRYVSGVDGGLYALRTSSGSARRSPSPQPVPPVVARRGGRGGPHRQ
ncbi:PQQ-binding-like beta-propeller repeat protein [Streptomyces sp. NRRL B-1347]|uniref:PQQ-binding-like beta-propeller repeat protein n=1 Tax=Streptomyces sp. NRRL B-1347 TaxID=1476877 RepID=UPI00099CA811